MKGITLGSVFALVTLLSCGGEDALPPTAQPEITAMLRADLEQSPHPSDGGGVGRLIPELSDIPAVVSEPGRWTLEYEAGPLGVEVGGTVFLQVSPFWGWSTPQVARPSAPGYTEVTTSAAGVELEARTMDQQLLGIRVSGRRMEEGETIRVVYGAGSAGAYPDRYAESASRFWFAVDGDGDGSRRVVADSPAVAVRPGPAAAVLVHLPSTGRAGERVWATIAVVDGAGNRAADFSGAVDLVGSVDLAGLPATFQLKPEDRGARRIEIELPASGVLRVTASGPDDLWGESNPLVVGGELRILWADLHGHSGFSDGTGSPNDYFEYARDVAALDVVALTDHDHWGIRPLAENPDMWEQIRRKVEALYEPGAFVTLLGFEWTNWIYGHRHVLYFTEKGDVLSSVERRFEHPRQLWEALRGEDAMTLAHHSAGGPVATDWRIAPDEELEPLTEVASVHGSSEAPDAPHPIYRPLDGNFVRDALDRGYRLGFVGSGDGHDGHPGLAHLTSPRMGGVAAILAEEATRESVLSALRARRTYATNGPRIYVHTSVDGQPMGSRLDPRPSATLSVHVVPTAALQVVEVVRSGRTVDLIDCTSPLLCSGSVDLADLAAGEYVYVRAVQEDGGAAWSSPFFIE